MQKRMDMVKHHFETEAKVFDGNILNSVPRYQEMLQAAVNMLPFDRSASPVIMDVGTGTGNLALAVKTAFPKAKLVCLDLAANMLDTAREKLKAYPDVEYIQADASSYRFDRKYDAIVSSLTLHHLETDNDKHKFHVKACKALNREGMFVNCDIITAPEKALQEVNLSVWKAYILKSSSPEFVEDRYKKYLAEDRPAAVINMLISLKKAGFRYVDVFWKYYNFAVYGGKRGR